MRSIIYFLQVDLSERLSVLTESQPKYDNQRQILQLLPKSVLFTKSGYAPKSNTRANAG
ncbi:hypothetical protein ABNB56_09875 [Streptococcus iniae]|uniref:hypothetical protein n=1 Tax=Streptococcus iniae TaxID=1346 RepID=UPI0016050A45|nr:hypothetical protein [Streptococcus iniae]